MLKRSSTYVRQIDMGYLKTTSCYGSSIYRHYDSILDEYIESGIENMKFVREWWDVEKVYNEIKLFDGEELGGMGYHIFEDEDDKEDWLADYMLEHRTWPEPIIVLDNLSLTSWGKPFHLMEGHRRLDYFREVYQEERDTLKSLHEVWVVTLKSDRI